MGFHPVNLEKWGLNSSFGGEFQTSGPCPCNFVGSIPKVLASQVLLLNSSTPGIRDGDPCNCSGDLQKERSDKERLADLQDRRRGKHQSHCVRNLNLPAEMALNWGTHYNYGWVPVICHRNIIYLDERVTSLSGSGWKTTVSQCESRWQWPWTGYPLSTPKHHPVGTPHYISMISPHEYIPVQFLVESPQFLMRPSDIPRKPGTAADRGRPRP